MVVVAYLSLSGSGRGVGWGGRFFEAGRLTFSAFSIDAYSRWGAYLNKYGMTTVLTHTAFTCFYAF